MDNTLKKRQRRDSQERKSHLLHLPCEKVLHLGCDNQHTRLEVGGGRWEVGGGRMTKGSRGGGCERGEPF